MDSRPNIVLMVSDDHGKEALGCYGNKVIKTPNLDNLANDGIRLLNGFCTTSSCGASRSTILTGLHNHANGAYGHVHGKHHFSCFENIKTLPHYLKSAGYRTGRVGKKHFAPESLFPFDWGIGEYEFDRNDVKMSDACQEFIKKSEPFFLYWCSHNPHRHGILNNHPLKPNDFGNPSSPFEGDEEEVFSEKDVIVPHFLNDSPESRAELSQYYQSIARLDRGVGRLINILKKESKYENTFILYISDNGPAFPHAKTNLYDPGMNLPCIVHSPMHKNKGTTCDGLVSWSDITPTLLDCANFSIDTPLHGKSFLGILDEISPVNWRDKIFASHTFHEITNYYPMRVIRTKTHKFIYNIAWKLDYSFSTDLYSSSTWQAILRENSLQLGERMVEKYVHRPQFELYDIRKDPNEINNLAYDKTYETMVHEFSENLKKFQKETNDPWYHKWTYE